MAVLFAAISEPAAWLELNEYLLNDWPHPCFLTSLFPLPQFLPLFTVYPIIRSAFLKTTSYPLLYKVGYKKYIRKRGQTTNPWVHQPPKQLIQYGSAFLSHPHAEAGQAVQAQKMPFLKFSLSLGGPPARLLPRLCYLQTQQKGCLATTIRLLASKSLICVLHAHSAVLT